MDINSLSIPFVAINNRRDDNQCVLGDEIPNASLFLDALATAVGGQFELQGTSGSNKKEEAAYPLQEVCVERHPVSKHSSRCRCRLRYEAGNSVDAVSKSSDCFSPGRIS